MGQEDESECRVSSCMIRQSTPCHLLTSKHGLFMSIPKKCWVREGTVESCFPSKKLVPRSFDPMIDQHPVQWLLDNLKPELYTPMNEWFAEVLGRQPLHPSDVMMPDWTSIKKSWVVQMGFVYPLSTGFPGSSRWCRIWLQQPCVWRFQFWPLLPRPPPMAFQS